MSAPLVIGVLAAGAWALLALTAQVARARAHGRSEQYAPAAGRPFSGVLYAFGPGMLPWAKESVREHLPSYGAGVGYHLGIFAAGAYLVLLLAGLTAAPFVLRALRFLSLAGALCGVILLIKRTAQPQLRGLSGPDDYVANALATAFTALAFADATRSASLDPGFPAAMAAGAAAPLTALRGTFLGEAVLLLLYIPVGKIRHCFFFFTTRYYLGAHFGRRGTFPPHA